MSSLEIQRMFGRDGVRAAGCWRACGVVRASGAARTMAAQIAARPIDR